MTRISINGYEPAHLSFSTVSGFRMCGKKFELQKVLRLEEKPGLAAIGGNAVHTATEDFDLGKWSPGTPSGEAAEIARLEGQSLRIPSSDEVDIVRSDGHTGSTDEGSAE